MRERTRRALAALVAALTLTGATLVAALPAEAAVTNCWTNKQYQYVSGGCTSTTANPPYTTRFAQMVQCSNGTTYTSGYVKAQPGAFVSVACPPNKHVTAWWKLFA